MRAHFVIPILASILILGTLGLSYDAFAGKDDNNGNKGCENANPNSKACEKNPNTESLPSIELEIYVDGVKQFFEPYNFSSTDEGSATQDASGVIRLSLNVICDPLDVGCSEEAYVVAVPAAYFPIGTTVNFKIIEIVGFPEDTIRATCAVLYPDSLYLEIPQDTIIGDNVLTLTDGTYTLRYGCLLSTNVT